MSSSVQHPNSKLTQHSPNVITVCYGFSLVGRVLCWRASLRKAFSWLNWLPVNSSHNYLVTRSCRHTVNSSPVNSSHTHLITQSTCQRRAHNKAISCNFWATVCKTVRPMLSVRCPVLSVCLSVTFVDCGQTVGRIKTKLGMQVGLGPGHIVLDRDPAPPPPKGHMPPPIFGPYLLRPNGWMD